MKITAMKVAERLSIEVDGKTMSWMDNAPIKVTTTPVDWNTDSFDLIVGIKKFTVTVTEKKS